MIFTVVLHCVVLLEFDTTFLPLLYHFRANSWPFKSFLKAIVWNNADHKVGRQWGLVVFTRLKCSY